MSMMLLIRLKGISLFLFIKLAAAALSPTWALLGAVGAVFGWVYHSYWAVPIRIVGSRHYHTIPCGYRQLFLLVV